VILPFRREPRRGRAGNYVVRGRYERHRRKFNFYATSAEEAQRLALTYIRAIHSQSSGPYTRLVWQYGVITMTDDHGVVVTLPPCPPPPTLVQ